MAYNIAEPVEFHPQMVTTHGPFVLQTRVLNWGPLIYNPPSALPTPKYRLLRAIECLEQPCGVFNGTLCSLLGSPLS